MGVGTLFIAANIYLLWSQRRREIKMHTIENIERIVKALWQFRKDAENLPDPTPDYTTENQQWYRETVEPYLDFMLWLYLQLDNHLFKLRIIKLYNPQIEANYMKVKPYIEVCREQYGATAWEEIEKLMKKLSIQTTAK